MSLFNKFLFIEKNETQNGSPRQNSRIILQPVGKQQIAIVHNVRGWPLSGEFAFVE